MRHRTVRNIPQLKWYRRTYEQNSDRKNTMHALKCLFNKRVMGWAVNTTCYLVNISPYLALNLKTPEEMCSGSPTKYNNLKIFYCPIYAHINEGKIEPRGKMHFSWIFRRCEGTSCRILIQKNASLVVTWLSMKLKFLKYKKS